MFHSKCVQICAVAILKVCEIYCLIVAFLHITFYSILRQPLLTEKAN